MNIDDFFEGLFNFGYNLTIGVVEFFLKALGVNTSKTGTSCFVVVISMVIFCSTAFCIVQFLLSDY